MVDAPWYCYLARCQDGSLYAGITTDLARRMAAHNEGTGAKCTRSRRPVRLVWWEVLGSKSDAAKREAEIKSWKKKRRDQRDSKPAMSDMPLFLRAKTLSPALFFCTMSAWPLRGPAETEGCSEHDPVLIENHLYEVSQECPQAMGSLKAEVQPGFQ